jgi:hypothetical protein
MSHCKTVDEFLHRLIDNGNKNLCQHPVCALSVVVMQIGKHPGLMKPDGVSENDVSIPMATDRIDVAKSSSHLSQTEIDGDHPCYQQLSFWSYSDRTARLGVSAG